MARVNIEECWWSDPRRMKLILKIGFVADSAVVNMWRTAQEFWGRSRGLIPKDIFDTLEFASDLLGVCLAEVRGDMVYVRGSSAYLDWHAEKREAAKKGGQKSAQRPRNAKGQLQKTSKQNPSKNQAEPKLSQASGSGSLSDSLSGSGSGSVVTNSSNSSQKAHAFVKAYCDRFKLRWGENPQILGKDAGIAKRLAKDLSLERFEYLLDAYFQMPDSWLVKTKHPLATFETKLNEVVVFAESGKFTTAREAHNADNMATNAMLLEKVRRGEI